MITLRAPSTFHLRKLIVSIHRAAIAGKIPQDQAQGISSNTQSAVTALGGTLGGGVKGVVDTVGNTVGALGEGVTGTVQGVGDGVGSTVQFAGGALGAGAGKVGNMFTGSKQGGEGERVRKEYNCHIPNDITDAAEAHKERLQEATEGSKEISSDLTGTVEKASNDATAATKDTAAETQDAAGGFTKDADEKVRGVSSSSS